MATETLSLASEEHLNWYHESRYWMHVSDELTMKRAATLEGRAEGLVKGRAEGKLEIAKKMVAAGNFSKEQIIEITGISEDEFEKLK